jgi:hypothetical protein
MRTKLAGVHPRPGNPREPIDWPGCDFLAPPEPSAPTRRERRSARSLPSNSWVEQNATATLYLDGSDFMLMSPELRLLFLTRAPVRVTGMIRAETLEG